MATIMMEAPTPLAMNTSAMAKEIIRMNKMSMRFLGVFNGRGVNALIGLLVEHKGEKPRRDRRRRSRQQNIHTSQQ